MTLLEAIALIGRVLSGSEDPLADLIQPAPPAPKVDKSYLIRLNFRLDRAPCLEAEAVEIDPSVLRRYSWVGNAVGNRPQKYLTTNMLEYLVGPAPLNLLAALEAQGLEGASLYRRVAALVERFFRPLPDGTRILDPARLGLAEETFLEVVWEGTKGKPRERAKEVGKAVAGHLRQWVLKDLGIPAAAVVLWTLLYEGEPLAADPNYVALVLRDKGAAPAAGAAEGTAKGVCTVCGATDRPVTVDFARLDFLKYYINDKIGAASGVSEEGFWRNFSACPECFQGLVVAEKYVRQHLGLRVGSLDFLVLPAFLRQPEFGRRELENWAARLRTRVGALANVSQWLESLAGKGGLEEELLDFLEELPYEDVALLNFLFYRKSKSEFRVLGLAKDVAPGRLSHLLRQGNRLANWAVGHFGPDQWWLDLTRIYQLIPLAEGGREAEFKKLVHVYTALLTGRPLAYEFLIRQFMALAQIFLTRKFAGTNVRPPAAGSEELALARSLMQANLFLRLLGEEGLLEGGKFLSDHVLDLEPELLPEDMRAYFKEMAYDGPQAGLFILGYLLNQVGRAQGDGGYTNKPVLEKLNYQGMLWPKVVRLSNQILDHLRQHDLLRYHEGLFAAMKRLLDAHRLEWPLSPEENVFYILSGYAYATRLAFKAWAQKQAAEGGS